MSDQAQQQHPLDRGFHVAHQKVSLDVNLSDWSLEGWTELTIVPIDPFLKQIRLDCRQCRVLGVTINDKKTSNFYREDILGSANMFKDSTINQHHQYREQIEPLMQESLSGELFIPFPKGFKLTPQDPTSDSIMAGASGYMSAYAPITIKVDFSLRNPNTGINFVGGIDSMIKKPYWHAYTTQQPLGQATSSWLPCIDGIWDPCTWQIEISVPRTVRDIGNPKPIFNTKNNKRSAAVTEEENATNEEEEEDNVRVEEELSLSDSELEELNREIVVVSNNSPASEVAHPFDESKKVVSFDVFTPVSPQHIGFSVGAFVQTPINDFRENGDGDEEMGGDDDDDNSRKKKSSDSIPISVYSFPHLAENALNTCIFLYKAMDFFSKEYGSYPFSSYSVCFVDDAQFKTASSTALSICSEQLIFPPDVIEPLFSSTKILTTCLADQWSGVNIVPKSWSDIWITLGLARFMSQNFIRKLFGNNEYRFQLKKQAEKICERDINKPPLSAPVLNFPIITTNDDEDDDDDLSFIKLKAPVILFILDRRMTKTDRSLGLSRVLPKLFLQAMSGDLNNASLSTSQFIRLCERVSHNRLDSFFDQWVYGSGYPIFRVTQRFNKKRMFVEMGIRQVQNSEIENPDLNPKNFVQDAKEHLDGTADYPVQPIFTGPMTIRIHEADGTPYEHVVDLKENFTKLDIQYNTKYKRLKRNKKNQGGGETIDHTNTPTPAASSGNNIDDDTGLDPNNMDGVLLHSLGDVLQSDRESSEWKITEWSKEEEDKMVNEAFEWIRVDSDFEWICKLYINQPDYMFSSQLQQDRDVVAQYDAVKYFAAQHQRPSSLYSSILIKTVMDKRYYYGIRVEAAQALANCAVESTGFIGKFHLMRAFQTLYCFEGSSIPRANNFSDFTSYFLQKAIPLALSKIRDESGNCPMDVKNFLLDLLRYNENSNNPYSDSYYISELIIALVNSLRRVEGVFYDEENPELKSFVSKAVDEIDRCTRMDKWIPSVHNIITLTALEQKLSLVRDGYIPMKYDDLICYTRRENNSDVRLSAFKGILSLGGLRIKQLLHYAFITSAYDNSCYIRNKMITTLREVIGWIALKGEGGKDEVKKEDANNGGGTMMVLDNNYSSRKEALSRSTIHGAIEMMRTKFEKNNQPHFKREIWTAINENTKYGITQKRILLDIAETLYPAQNSFIVTLPTPRPKRLVAKHLDEGMIVIKREGRLKIQIGSSGNNEENTNGGNNAKLPKISLVSKKSANGKKKSSSKKPNSNEQEGKKVKLKLKGL